MGEVTVKIEEPKDRLTKIEKTLDAMQKALARELAEKDDSAEEAFGSELRDRDHRSHITMAMTLGSPKDLEKSADIGSGPLMDWHISTDIDGQVMSPIFQIPRKSNLAHSWSKDRKSRGEYKEILSKGNLMQDQYGNIYNSGPPILKKELKDQKEQMDESPDE